MAGDLDAAREVRAIIMARVRLLGLVEQAKPLGGWTPQKVVLSDEDRRTLGL